MNIIGESESVDTSTLSGLLNEYGQPAIITEEKEPETKETETQQEKTESWKGNPGYYQTGKKAGQPKPSVNKVRVEYKASTEPTTIDGDLIPATLFLTVIDLLLPGAIVLVHNFAVPNKKLKFSDLQLSKDVKKQIEPLADRAKKQILLTASPTTVFLFTMAALYTMQYLTALLLAKDESKK